MGVRREREHAVCRFRFGLQGGMEEGVQILRDIGGTGVEQAAVQLDKEAPLVVPEADFVCCFRIGAGDIL